MKFTLSWLKDYLETDADSERIADALTQLGLEVESCTNRALGLEDFICARIVSAEKHPQADRLQLCQVDIGADKPVQVVCGADNARTNLKVVYAAAGIIIPSTGKKLKASKIRGVESMGMLCSAAELGLGDDSEGIWELGEDTPIGQTLIEALQLNDPIFDLAITPNRPDCLSVIGIARDLAAMGLGDFKHKTPEAIKGQYPNPLQVTIKDYEGCPAFLGRVIRNVQNGQSPDWMRRRLEAAGLRPISALVDVTNYLLIDRGHPLHVYDLDRIEGNIIVRPALPEEEIEALNGKRYTLPEQSCLIADTNHALGIAGIMGSESSGCIDETRDIVIECAWFNPARITRTGQALGLMSDARQRFERGVDPNGMNDSMEAATGMILELCGGEPSETFLAGAIPDHSRKVRYRPERCLSLGGLDIPIDRQVSILEALGFHVDPSQTPWAISPPSWRPDIDGEADLVEEILRIKGYDSIPLIPLDVASDQLKPVATRKQSQTARLRRTAAGLGYHEALTYSFIEEEDAKIFGETGWIVENPIASGLSHMRTSLVPGLLRAVKNNQDRGAEQIRLFEIGRQYFGANYGFERKVLTLIAAGKKQARHWNVNSGDEIYYDFWDSKRDALSLLQTLHLPVRKLSNDRTLAPDCYHPGRSSGLCLEPGKPLAIVGELHPRVLKYFDIEGPVIAIELGLEGLPEPKPDRQKPYREQKLQPVQRDFAFIVPNELPAMQLVQAVRGSAKADIIDISIFDVYTGDGIDQGEKSIALSVTLQPIRASYTDADLDALGQKIIQAAQKTVGARLRE